MKASSSDNLATYFCNVPLDIHSSMCIIIHPYGFAFVQSLSLFVLFLSQPLYQSSCASPDAHVSLSY